MNPSASEPRAQTGYTIPAAHASARQTPDAVSARDVEILVDSLGFVRERQHDGEASTNARGLRLLRHEMLGVTATATGKFAGERYRDSSVAHPLQDETVLGQFFPTTVSCDIPRTSWRVLKPALATPIISGTTTRRKPWTRWTITPQKNPILRGVESLC
jgi:hypothetical protein